MTLTARSHRSSVLVGAIIGTLAGAASFTARADDPPPGWSGAGQLGYLSSRGNTNTDSANANLNIIDVAGDWKHALSLDGLFGKSGQVVAAERWDVRFQSDYKISDNWFGFGALDFEHDMFTGFQYQASVSAGVGYNIINTPSTKLAVLAGPGYRSLRPELEMPDPIYPNFIDRIPQERESSAIGAGGFNFEHAFNDSTKITDKLLFQTGSSNTSINNILAITVKMSKKLSLAAGYTVLDNSSPPVGIKRIDRQTTLNLVYAFPGAKPAASAN